MKAPLCESICVVCWSFAATISKPRNICRKIPRYLQHFAASTCTLPGMMQHQFIARSFAIGQSFSSSAKLTSANCMVFARFGIISVNYVVISQRSEAKKTVHCRMLATFRNQKLLLAQYVRHTGAKFSASQDLCSILELSLVNRMASAAF